MGLGEHTLARSKGVGIRHVAHFFGGLVDLLWMGEGPPQWRPSGGGHDPGGSSPALDREGYPCGKVTTRVFVKTDLRLDAIPKTQTPVVWDGCCARVGDRSAEVVDLARRLSSPLKQNVVYV